MQHPYSCGVSVDRFRTIGRLILRHLFAIHLEAIGFFSSSELLCRLCAQPYHTSEPQPLPFITTKAGGDSSEHDPPANCYIKVMPGIQPIGRVIEACGITSHS
jgi:hypothetical protein